MAATTSYWCYQCNRFFLISNEDPITCPDCDGGFIEQIDNVPHAARALHADSRLVRGNGFSTTLRRSRMNGGDRSPFNPLIVLASPSGGSTNVEQSGRGFELYYDDGGGLGLRPLPARLSEFLLGPGFDRLIEQLSEMEIQNIGRHDQPPASKAAVEAMPMVEIDDTHIQNELFCAVCKEQFELGTKVLNMPCNHLYHSNCLLPWLRLRNSCPVCRHELPAAVGEEGDGSSNSLDETPVGLTIWRLPGGGFAVGRFSGGENREFPGVYTEMDGGFSGGGLVPRRVSWGSGGRERGGYVRRVLGNMFGCFSGSSSSPRLDSRIRRSGRSFSIFSPSRRRGWALELDNARSRSRRRRR